MGDVQGLGTEGNVFVELIGSKGKTERIVLREADDSRIKFEKGKSYKFTIETADIGTVSYSINIFVLDVFRMFYRMNITKYF